MPVSRRDFLTAGATAAAGVALGTPLLAETAPADRAPRPSSLVPQFARPVVIASDNGIRGADWRAAAKALRIVLSAHAWSSLGAFGHLWPGLVTFGGPLLDP